MWVECELLVVWVVVVGLLKNKLILVLFVLVISVFILWVVILLLMLGGLYFCLEGVEKLVYKWLYGVVEEVVEYVVELVVLVDESVDMVVFEVDKIKGVICIDFVFLVEIIVIMFGIVVG